MESDFVYNVHSFVIIFVEFAINNLLMEKMWCKSLRTYLYIYHISWIGLHNLNVYSPLNARNDKYSQTFQKNWSILLEQESPMLLSQFCGVVLSLSRVNGQLIFSVMTTTSDGTVEGIQAYFAFKLSKSLASHALLRTLWLVIYQSSFLKCDTLVLKIAATFSKFVVSCVRSLITCHQDQLSSLNR